MFNSLPEVTAQADTNTVVCWKNDDYRLQCDLYGQWQVVYKPWKITKMIVVPLYQTDGISSVYDPADFYVKERTL